MVIESVVHPAKTLEKLNEQRLSSAFTDVTVIVAGQHFSVHKSLLAAHSAVFYSVLQDTALSQTPNINIDGVDSEYFRVIVDFLYTSKLRVTPANVDLLHATALFLQMPEIIELCAQFKREHKEVFNRVQLAEKLKASPAPVEDVSKQEIEKVDVSLLQAKQVKNMMVEVFGSDMPPTRDEEEAGSTSRMNWAEAKDSPSKGEMTAEQVEEAKKQKRRGRKPQIRVSCEVCNKVMTKTKYEVHKRIHTGEKPFQCSECGKQFASIYNKRIHERIHTGERPYHCELCNKTFSDPSTTRKHRLWHAGVKNKRCGICGRHFASLTQVREHMRTHTKEKPYICTECGKAYGYRCDLKRHMREHTGNMFGPCEECGKYFNHRGNYFSHLKTHKAKNNSAARQLKLQDSGMVTPDGRIILKAKICDSDPMSSAMLMVPANQQGGSSHDNSDVTMQHGHHDDDVTMLMVPAHEQGESSHGHSDVTIQDGHHGDQDTETVEVQEINQDGEIEVTIINRRFYVKQPSLNENEAILDGGQIMVKNDGITVTRASSATSQTELFDEQADASLSPDHVLMFVQQTEDINLPTSSLQDSDKNADSPSSSGLHTSEEVKPFVIME